MAHDGLCSLRIICKSASCIKLTCVINADLVAISYVDASCYLDRVMHEVVTSTAVGRASRHVHFALQWCGVRRKVCVVRLGSVRSIAPTALVSRTTRVKPSPGPGGGPKSNTPQHLPRPCTHASTVLGREIR